MKKLLIPLIIIFIVGCKNSNSRKADLSGIDLKINILRFDKDLWTLKDSPNRKDDLRRLFEKYPNFAPIYFYNVVYFGNNQDTILSVLTHFFSDTTVEKLYVDVLKKYDKVSNIEKELTQAFRRGKYFFPDYPTPNCMFAVSLINQNVIVTDSLITIGIDKYLGENYPLYSQNSDNYEYLVKNWKPEKIVSDLIYAWLVTEIPFEKQNEQLLDELIYKGKILYLTSLLLPDEKRNIIMGYSDEEWAWCKKNENAMWKTLVVEKHLFSSEYTLKLKYLNDAPFTQPFTQESPGRAGQYIAWQIVEAYMNKNQNISPMQLIQEKNAQKILEYSGYNP